MVDSLMGIHPHPGPTRRGVRSRRRAEGGEMRLGGEEGGGGTGEGTGGRRKSSGIDGAVVGGDMECEEAECEGNE